MNNFIRAHPGLLTTNFAFLLNKKELLDFNNKKQWFKSRMTLDIRKPLSIVIDRFNLLEDTCLQILDRSIYTLGKLNVQFKDEPGIGPGVRREFFNMITKELMNSDLGLFKLCANGSNYEPTTKNFKSIRNFIEFLEFSNFFIVDQLDYYKLCGIIVGLALRNDALLEMRFVTSFVKQLLDKTVTIEDLDTIDSNLYKNYKWILGNYFPSKLLFFKRNFQETSGSTDDLDLTFTVADENSKNILDLKTNGSKIPVTEENKQEYIDLIVEHKLITSTKEKMSLFKQGNKNFLRIFL